jgi:hypothetical protein
MCDEEESSFRVEGGLWGRKKTSGKTVDFGEDSRLWGRQQTLRKTADF